MKKDVLGIKIDDISITEVVKTVESWLSKPEKYYIVTPNPEILVAAQKDPLFRKILNDAHLSIPDGAGLKLSGKVKNTVRGVDLMEKLVELSSKKGYTVGLLGGRDGVAEEVAECLRKKYPGLKVSFADSGGEIDNSGNVIPRRSDSSRTDVGILIKKESRLPRSASGGPRNDSSVDLLFIAFGPPKQEKWIAKNLPKISVKVAMGVGGAFDYLSGRVPRAPKWLRVLGLEWLFRLMVQPWRIKRQLALIKYLWLLLVSSRCTSGSN